MWRRLFGDFEIIAILIRDFCYKLETTPKTVIHIVLSNRNAMWPTWVSKFAQKDWKRSVVLNREPALITVYSPWLLRYLNFFPVSEIGGDPDYLSNAPKKSKVDQYLRKWERPYDQTHPPTSYDGLKGMADGCHFHTNWNTADKSSLKERKRAQLSIFVTMASLFHFRTFSFGSCYIVFEFVH